MELTPYHFTLSTNMADSVWQMKHQCEPFPLSNRVVCSYSNPAGAQIVNFTSHFFEISLPEMNRARDPNSQGFAPALLPLKHLYRIIKSNEVFNAALAGTDPLIFLKGHKLGDKARKASKGRAGGRG